MGPHPTQVSDPKPPTARWRAATAVTAAVRAALISAPSMTATGWWVSTSFSTISALARSTPARLGLSCLEPIHLSPATGAGPPT